MRGNPATLECSCSSSEIFSMACLIDDLCGRVRKATVPESLSWVCECDRLCAEEVVQVNDFALGSYWFPTDLRWETLVVEQRSSGTVVSSRAGWQVQIDSSMED